MINIIHIESWWRKDGHFNMSHYLNVIRAKNERVYHHIQGQGQDLENKKETCPGIRQGSCSEQVQSLERSNH